MINGWGLPYPFLWLVFLFIPTFFLPLVSVQQQHNDQECMHNAPQIPFLTLSSITALIFCSSRSIPYYVFFLRSIPEILNNLCEDFLQKNVTTILYLTNSELFGRSTASSQYFLQLASYLGIPVIAWNADNSGLERRVSFLNIRKNISVKHRNRSK